MAEGARIAREFLEVIRDNVIKAEVAGSIRRQAKTVGDIEIVAIENPFNALDNALNPSKFEIKVFGRRLKRLKWQGAQIDLFITSEEDYGRILAIRTGSSNFSHLKLARGWREKGWVGTKQGLRRADECRKHKDRWELLPEKKGRETMPPRFDTEYAFFDFLGIPWVPPQDRNI